MVMRKIKLPVHSILGLHNLAAPHRLASLGPVLIVSPAHNACDTCSLKCLPDVVLLVKSHSFFQSQIEVNLQFPDPLGLLLYPRPGGIGPLADSDNCHML